MTIRNFGRMTANSPTITPGNQVTGAMYGSFSVAYCTHIRAVVPTQQHRASDTGIAYGYSNMQRVPDHPVYSRRDLPDYLPRSIYGSVNRRRSRCLVGSRSLQVLYLAGVLY